MTFDPSKHIIKLPGRKQGDPPTDYLEVKYRVKWFREENVSGIIVVESMGTHGEGTDEVYWMKAEVIGDPDQNGDRPASQAYGSALLWRVDKRNGDIYPNRDYIEKAETKAIGRALARLGYGVDAVGDEDLDPEIEDRQSASQPAKPQQITPKQSSPRQAQRSFEESSVDDEFVAQLRDDIRGVGSMPEFASIWNKVVTKTWKERSDIPPEITEAANDVRKRLGAAV